MNPVKTAAYDDKTSEKYAKTSDNISDRYNILRFLMMVLMTESTKNKVVDLIMYHITVCEICFYNTVIPLYAANIGTTVTD